MNARCALWMIRLLIRYGVLLAAPNLVGDQVAVRYMEGRIHGFLVLRDTEDKLLASGNLIQTATSSRVTTELSFVFKDGSVHQETAVFSQRRTFQLLNYRLVQKGPAFKRTLSMMLNASTGQVTVQYSDDDGKEKTITEN